MSFVISDECAHSHTCLLPVKPQPMGLVSYHFPLAEGQPSS